MPAMHWLAGRVALGHVRVRLAHHDLAEFIAVRFAARDGEPGRGGPTAESRWLTAVAALDEGLAATRL